MSDMEFSLFSMNVPAKVKVRAGARYSLHGQLCRVLLSRVKVSKLQCCGPKRVASWRSPSAANANRRQCARLHNLLTYTQTPDSVNHKVKGRSEIHLRSAAVPDPVSKPVRAREMGALVPIWIGPARRD